MNDIYAAINEVSKRVGSLEKKGELKIGATTQYKFLSIDDILAAVGPLEREVGIISFPADQHTEFHYNSNGSVGATDSRTGKTQPAPENVQALVNYTFRYVAISDGSFIDVKVPGEGIDSQDKATRKATTQAQKIAKILVYGLITGEPDPDGQNGAEAADKPVAPALTKARQASAPVTAPKSADDADYQSKIKAELVSKGLVTGPRANEVLKANGGSYKAAYEALNAEVKAAQG